ncbi:hypothetical protein CHS0354_032954 [Potamilus streckersoni]|uniref:STAS domain-containing protein n=2 Tax=Potamilus streckersoni TaxID=2493646 RepID=A0AAE0VLL8_9BIVA|nr:hypothetical protein CHS0354_032954 [Potamilus streckersoni]
MEKPLVGRMPNDDPESRETLIDQPNGYAKILIERSVYSQKNFDENYVPGYRPNPSVKEKLQQKCMHCRCSGDCWKNFILTVFPFINILKNYHIKQDLPGDLISGLTVGIMHLPQGMAYGMLTGLPPVYGLYSSFFPVILYFFFGSSRHISVGTFAVACLMVGSTVQKGVAAYKIAHPITPVLQDTNVSSNSSLLLDGRDEQYVHVQLAYAMSVSFVAGIVQLLLGIARMGFVTVYLSDALISGFTTGAACHVFTSQIKHVFSIKTERYSGAFKLVKTYIEFFGKIPTTNSVTLIASVVCMFILYMVSTYINANPKLKPKMKMPVPIELIVVLLGTVISYFVQLNSKYGVVIVGDIPTGLPVPAANQFTVITDVISDGIALAIVIFAISVSMAKILAKNYDYEIDANQELVAFGICNILSSFFSSYATSASLSRSLIQERVGGRTQVAGIVSSVLLLIVLLVLGPYFRSLPNCVLAAIIIIALRGMFLQVFDLVNLWKVAKIDFCVWIVAFLGTVLLDVDMGLAVGVIFALLTIICRSQRPYVCVVGQIPDTDIYRDISVYREAKEIEGIKIFRFEHSLFFVNTEHFKTNLFKVTVNPKELKIRRKRALDKQRRKDKKQKTLQTVITLGDSVELQVTGDEMEYVETSIIDLYPSLKTSFHTIILDCSTWSYVDSMGVKVLKSVIADFKDVDIKVYLASCKAGIREMFAVTKFYDQVSRENIFITLHDAVLYAQHVNQSQRQVQNTAQNGITQDLVDTAIEDGHDGIDNMAHVSPNHQTNSNVADA